MRDFKCAKCPETMSSKCPSERNVFCSEQYITMVSNTIVKKALPYNSNGQAKCLQLEYGCYEDGLSAAEMFKRMVNEIRSMTEVQAEILCCDHEWYLEEGVTCSLNGHDHNRREANTS